jgi:hypothetical protein
MVPDVAFQELSHQAVDCPSCRTDDLQHLRAIASLVEDPLKSLKLPPDAFAPQNQFLFVLYCMTHLQANDIMPELAPYLWGYVSLNHSFAPVCEAPMKGVERVEFCLEYCFSTTEGMLP